MSIQRKDSIRSVRSHLSSVQSLMEIELTAKPHAFSGAVLNPKHARELTPKTVLTITHTLGVHALDNANSYPGPNSNSADSGGTGSTYSNEDDNGGAGNGGKGVDNETAKVQYTVWITEAWRVLGWAEPSAALFWEMATMYYTLHVAARSIEVEETQLEFAGNDGNGMSFDEDGRYNIQRTLSQTIPPILSCGSSASMDENDEKTDKNDKKRDEKKGGSSSGNLGGGSRSGSRSPHHHIKKGSSSDNKKTSQNNKASAASAKELPVWLVGMFLLLHCEEEAFWRNVSGEDEQRFDALMAKHGQTSGSGNGSFDKIWKDGRGGVDFNMLFNLSSGGRSDAYGYSGRLDHSNCTAYLLRHLRKFLLLACMPHNADALLALYNLALSESQHDEEYLVRQHPHSHSRGGMGEGSSSVNHHPYEYATMNLDEILQRHEEEHGDVGLNVHMTSDDLERLNLVLQSPLGGLIDDPPLFISDIMPREELAIYGGMAIEDVEREIRRHLERELMNDDEQHDAHHGGANKNNNQEEKDGVETVTKEIGKLGMNEAKENMEDAKIGNKFQDSNFQDEGDYHKELIYTKVRGSTILLKPNAQTDNAANGRLHDVHVSGCSDSHIYLLQPFEHATISACSGCTIVVGSVAGLLHVVDCERTTITSAARRVLVSNCYDVTHNIFTPSPPLLVGDNRNCKFAPYNTYYDGLREDLLATGLAAALVSPGAENQNQGQVTSDPMYGPALQCASNKWKQPVELAKLSDLLQAQSIAPRSTSPIPGSSPGADDKAFSKTGADDAVKIPTLVPASEFQVLFVPFLSEATKERRARQEAIADELTVHTSGSEDNSSTVSGPKSGIGSMYCHHLADVLQLSPFRLPTEYERRANVKADRMKSLQTTIQTDLTPEQQIKLEEELNSGFRDWLVTSGNLRQVLDLVHLERKEV